MDSMESIHRRRSKAIGGAFQMKFTFEEKLAAVKLHKEKGTYKYPKGYEAKSKKQVYRFYVQFWEAQYDRNGEEGIRHELNSAYSPEKKLSIITPVLMGEITGRQQAIRCGVRPSSIVLWIKRYRKDGLEGLKSCHPGRKPKNMPVISEKKEETDKTVAEDNQEDLRKYGIIQSMSRKGNCLYNSKTENLFSKMKKEMFYGHENEFRSFAELKKAIDEYIFWYNNERIVTRLGGAPVCNRSIVPVSMLCYSSIKSPVRGVQYN